MNYPVELGGSVGVIKAEQGPFEVGNLSYDSFQKSQLYFKGTFPSLLY